MATEQSTIEVNVLTKGLTEATVSAQKLHDIMKATSQIAANIRIPTAVQAAQEQVAATNTRRSSPVMASPKPKGGGSGSNEYGTARGTVGTGAEGRDFAKQAQGLGGLVHVYATFAANLFAVSAAFTALSKAADTTNIIKGLDQLGAQSGRSLGGVAKAMVEATGGALSLREAMTSTALASSAGMTNAAMLRMTEVAKKASLALGRDMGDSMDRLTKGIAKVQPELLDELGIMARVIPSQEKYARELGKSVSALTDFEKKQAFANAVLEEGERKFSSITIDTNPYTQLSASLANVAQSGLELVNKVLGPLAEGLAKSPTGLALTLTGIAGILLKQAIPAIGQYRKGIADLAAENLKKVAEMQKIQGEAGYDYDTKIVGERARKKYLVQQDYAKKSLDEQKKILAESDKIAGDAAQASADRATSLLGHETVTNKIRDRMYQTAAISSAKYSVSQIQGAYGMRAAFSQLGEEINTLRSKGNMIDVGGGLMRQVPPINGFRAAIVGVSGAIGILGSTISTVINAFAPWILAITAVVAGVSFLIDSFRTATKETDAAGKAFEGVTGAVKTVGDTLDAIDKKPFLEQITNASVQAKASAINELSSSLTLLSKRTTEAYSKIDKGGIADKVNDLRIGQFWMKLLTPGQRVNYVDTSHLGKQLADGVQESLGAASKLVEGSIAEKGFRDSINKVLGITYTDAADLEKQLSQMPDTLIAKLPKLQKSLEDTNKVINNAASAGKELEAAWTAASKSYDDIVTSLTVTDPLGKLGEETIKVGIAMTKAFEDPKNRLAELRATAKDMSRLRFLDPTTQRDMMIYAQGLDEAAKKVDKLKEKLKVSQAKEAAAITTFSIPDMLGGTTGTEGTNVDQAKLAAAQQESKNIQKQIDAENKKLDRQDLYLRIQDQTFISGAERVQKSIGIGFEKAAIALSQSLVSNTGNTKEGLARQAELQIKMLDADAANLNAMLALVTSNTELARIQEEIAIIDRRKLINDERASGKIGDAEQRKETAKLMVRELALNQSRKETNFQQNTKDLSSTNEVTKRAAQMNFPEQMAKEQTRAQLAMVESKKEGVRLDQKSKEILLDVDAETKILDILTKGLNVRQAELGLLTQSSAYENKNLLSAKQDLEDKVISNNQLKEELSIRGQIRDAQMRLGKARDSKDINAELKTIAKFELDLSQKRKMFADDARILEFKRIQDAKQVQIAEFNYLKDFQLLNNTINTDSLSAIQSTTSLYLDFVQEQKASIELSNLKLNYDKQSNVELQNQIVLQDQINKLTGDPKKAKELAGVQQSLAESEARSTQLQIKNASDITNLNIKNNKLRLDGLESIRKKQADIAFAEIDTANKIAIIKLDAEEKLIQGKLSLGRISETTAARMTAEIAQSRFQKELQTQAALEKKTQDEETKAREARAAQLSDALNAINADYENKRVELARKAQEEIDNLKKMPIAKPGENTSGAVTQDFVDTKIANISGAQQASIAELNIKQEKAKAEQSANTALLDKEALNTQTQRLGIQNATNVSKAQELALTKEIQAQQSILNQLSKDQSFYTEMADSAAKSFAAGLTDAGKALGDVIKLLAQSATVSQRYGIERLNAEKAVADTAGKSTEDQLRDRENLAQLDARYYAQRIDNIASVAGAAAGLFEKDSKQYTKLMALEKILHLAKLTAMIVEQVRFMKDWLVRMTSTKAEVALATTKAAVGTASSAIGTAGKVAEVAGKLIPGNTDPIAGKVDYGLSLAKLPNALGSGPSLTGGLSSAAAPAAAAGEAGGIMSMLGSAGAGIMAAAPWIAGGIALLSLFGGKDKPKGPTPEELASVSGTGMRYNADGKLEASGTGALGDAKAANEGIAKSIDYLAKINYENLQFDKNKALVALEAIRDNTQNFVKAVGATGKIGDLTAGGVELNKKSGFLGFNSSSTTLAASGVKITGTIGEIADGLGGAIKKFEDIRRSKSSFWGLSSSSSVTRSETDVSDAAEGFIKNTIGSFRTAIQASAASFGQDGGLLKPIIDQIDISFTAYQTGETSADFANRVQEELGNKLDTAVKAVFPGIQSLADNFQNFGETLSEFAMRVQGDSEQIKFAFQSIGQNYIDTSGGGAGGSMAQRSAEQTLVKAFGGSQELFAAIDKYGNSMLTEAERLAPVRDNVNKKLIELFPALSAGGKSLITTREEFDNLRKTLDPLNPATADLWASMTKLGPAFASVTEETKKLSEAELKKAKQDQYSTILALKGDDLSKLKALTITRQRELDAMDDLLKPNQLYIYALQDEAAAKDKLQSSYDKVKTAITGTIDSLKSQVTVLQDYKKNLQVGDKGNLTPQEAYAASKGQLESAAALAQQDLGPGASKSEIAARDKAVSNLPTLIDQFLTQSKTSFASGDQYQADFSWVNALLDTTTEQLTSQETDAEKQLSALNDSVSYLTTIDESSKTTAILMSEFLANQVTYETAAANASTLLSQELTNILAGLATQVTPVKGFAMGGLANRGVNMVGENGPELVDFASPGRVYTAGQTAAFGDTTALVAELKSLKDELSQLRNDQKEQTGHIIQSNYDANNRNAQALSTVTENAIKQQTWKERSQVIIA